MNSFKFQSSRRVDHFRTATSNVLEIAKAVSQVGEIQSKIMLNDFFIPGESNNVSNFTKTPVPAGFCDTLSRCEDKSTGTVQNSEISTLKTNNSDPGSLMSGKSNSSYFKTYKGIKTVKSDKIFKNLSTLYRLHQEREKSLEEINKIPLQQLQDQFQELAAKDVVSRKVDKIRDLNEHLKKVVLEVAQLKQKLRRPIFQDTWDMQIHHHKFIVQFFDISKILMTELEKNVETYQWIGLQDINKSLDMKPFLILLHTVIMQLEKYFGSLAEFRKVLGNNFD